MPNTPFDFRDLVNHLTQNGQATLPPMDVQRMGIIAGYDPQWYDGDGNVYPAVSVYIAGDEYATPGVRFDATYTPHLGDTVFLVQTGQDAYVTGSLSGNIKAATAQAIGGAISVVATTSISLNATYAVGTSVINQANLSAPILPNRLYKAEANFTYTMSGISATGTPTNVSFQVITPEGTSPIGGQAVTANGKVSTHGFVVSSDIPTTQLTSGQWSAKYPNNKFTWQVETIITSGATPSMTFSGSAKNITIIVSDMGPAS
jgi:hypothetical protein